MISKHSTKSGNTAAADVYSYHLRRLLDREFIGQTVNDNSNVISSHFTKKMHEKRSLLLEEVEKVSIWHRRVDDLENGTPQQMIGSFFSPSHFGTDPAATRYNCEMMAGLPVFSWQSKFCLRWTTNPSEFLHLVQL